MLSFLYPHLLWALALLPLFYLLIRLLPPRPQQVKFPALALLKNLPTRLPPPRTPPWWLLLLRLVMVALFIIGLSHPMLRRDSVELGRNPLVILVDNGWQAAQNWGVIKERLTLTLQQAQADGTDVLIQGTADPVAENMRLYPAAQALKRLPEIAPRPWPADSATAAQALATTFAEQAAPLRPLWLTDGMSLPSVRKKTISALESIGRSRIFMPPIGALPIAITGVTAEQAAFRLTLQRTGGGERPVSASLYTLDGTFITRAATTFKTGEKQTSLSMALPKTVNEPGYFLIDAQPHIGAWYGMGTIAGLPKVGVIGAVKNDFPLLDGGFYIEQALKNTLTPQRLQPTAPPDGFDVLFVTTQPNKPELLKTWVEAGGVLVTFAGDWLEKNRTVDDLLPVRLRDYPREVAGTLSWTGALTIKAANPESPLRLIAPLLQAAEKNTLSPEDTYITKQILPQAEANSAELTWLTLADDTPLVSGKKMGNGWQVFVHVPADASWSTVPLSGVFVALLNTLVHLKTLQNQPIDDDDVIFPLTPFKLLQADGTLTAAAGGIALTEKTGLAAATPPGLYGNRKAPYIHQLPAEERIQAAITPSNVDGLLARYYDDAEKHQPLQHIFLTLALVLAVLDSLLRLNLIHRFFLRRASLLGLFFALIFATPAYAQSNSPVLPRGLPEGAYDIQLAYVDTGNERLNTLAENGLKSLSRMLEMRTTIEPAPPKKVNPAADDLGYYPVLYWQVLPNLGNISEKAAQNLRKYVDNGGVILLDGLSDLGAAHNAVKLVLHQILPFPLRALDGGHVLNRTYYLLEGKTPGRVDGLLWIDTAHRLPRVLTASNDWASAWAYDDYGKAMRAVTPGGEQQRTLAFRFGVNLVMYALLGDYKADQLHVDTLLKKLEERR